MSGLDATATDLTSLATFLAKLEALSKETGVKITHYDTIGLTTAGGVEALMAGSQTTEGYYAIKEVGQ